MHPKIRRLYEIRRLDDEAQCHEFSSLCEELAEDRDPSRLEDLFSVFTDQTEHYEVMVDLQGLVEYYPKKSYISALVIALPRMLRGARDWAKALLRSALQSPVRAAFLRTERLKQDSVDRDLTAPLFREVAKETPQVETLALELADL